MEETLDHREATKERAETEGVQTAENTLPHAAMLTRRSFVGGTSVTAAALMLSGLGWGSLTGCAKSAATGDSAEGMTFTNTTERLDGHSEADLISFTEERTFEAVVPLKDRTVDELLAAVENGSVAWLLARYDVPFDEEAFPYQKRGGALESWRTVATEGQPEMEFFTDIVTTVEEIDGTPSLKLAFKNNLLYGYDGVDGRNEGVTIGSLLDHVGTYELSCAVDGVEVGNVEVAMLPYDYFHTQAAIDAELDELVTAANANGLFAEKRTIGTSAGGREVNAVFLAAHESDLTDHLALVARMETEPAKVQEEVRSGELKYKVPIVYNNIHPNEIIGSDAIMEFLRFAASNESIDYFSVTGLTDRGKEQLALEMEADGTVWSELVAGKVTGVGYIQGNGKMNPNPIEDNPDMTVDMSDEEFNSYYDVETASFDPVALFDNVFFILVPSENPDGRTWNTRTNGNGFDLNRDNTYQTQPETQAMTGLIAQWNPISLHEIHGYYSQFQVEPCSPTHDPNNEYDLFMETCLAQGEAFMAAAIANNASINSGQIPLRDYLKRTDDGSLCWENPFDDMTSSYTPQYAMLHGANAYTVELAWGSQDAVDATVYGMMGNARFVAENKDELFLNQLERYRRGIENIDEDAIRPYYVDQTDRLGADADNFRPRYAENQNFFPEYYLIPLNSNAQRDRAAARDMVEYLIHNRVAVMGLDEDVILPANEFRGEVRCTAGDVVVDMHQAKRNMANASLYSNLVVANWTKLYSEPVTNFPDFRGFDVEVVTTPEAFATAKMHPLEAAPVVETVLVGDGSTVVIDNNGIQALQAVNELLAAGETVGIITEGEHRGDFVVARASFDKVSSVYVLDATATKITPVAKSIAPDIAIYVSRAGEEFMVDENGEPYGLKGYTGWETQSYNWDRFALGNQMGFTIVEALEDASVLVGSCALDEAEAAAVQGGKPCVAYSQAALASLRDAGLDIEIDIEADGLFDTLTTVSFPEESLITAPYQDKNDYLFYGHGGSFITAVPKEAHVLVKTTDDDFIEGFIDETHRERYKNTVQAIDFQDGDWNVTLFANSMTNKAHQLHEYRYLAMAIYDKFLQGDVAFS